MLKVENLVGGTEKKKLNLYELNTWHFMYWLSIHIH